MKELIRNRRVVFSAVILIQTAICIFVFLQYRGESVLYDFSTENMVSDSVFIESFLESQDSGYYIDNSEGGGKENFVSTVPVDLKLGMYKIVFHYQCSEGNNSYFIASDNMDFREWLGNYNKSIPSDRETYTANIWLSRKMPNFEVRFNYGGDGYLFVSKVEIIENRNWVVGAGTLLLLLFLCMDLLFIFKNNIKGLAENREWKNRVFVVCVIIIFASLPLFTFYLFKGHDLGFHLMRIEGVKEGIQSGQFPVRMQPQWLNGYGYGVSLFYGDILLYLPAVLRILGMGVQTAYKCFVLFINIMTAGIAYYCFKRLFRDEKLGLLGCMLYTTSVYRMVCIYVRASVGEYCALMFLPLIITSVYEILWQDERKENLRSSWLMGVVGFSGIILSHVISTEIIAFFVLIFCLVYWRRTFRKGALLQFIKMGMGILICTAWFLVPFFDVFRGEYKFNTEVGGGTIQTAGVFLGQLFSLFPYAKGNAESYSVVEGAGVGDEMCFSIGGGLMAGILLFIIYRINYGQKKSKQVVMGKMLLIISGVLMIMTTVYFPWNDLSQTGSVLEFLINNIQFPWRLLGLATMFLTALAILSVKALTRVETSKGKTAYMIVLLFTIISSGYFVSRLINDNHTVYIQNSDDISTYGVIGGEYIPMNANVEATHETRRVVGSEEVMIQAVERRYQKFEINCSNQADKEGYIDLPLLYYKGYGVKASDMEEEIEVGKNGSGFLRIILPGGFSGNITIDYYGRWYWRLAEMVSLAGVVVFGIYLVYTRKNK